MLSRGKVYVWIQQTLGMSWLHFHEFGMKINKQIIIIMNANWTIKLESLFRLFRSVSWT